MRFELGEDLVVVVPDHLVLRLLLPHCPLQVGDAEVQGLVGISLRLRVFVLLEAFDVEVDAVLRVDVFDVPAVEVGSRLLLDDICLLEDDLALLLLDLHVGHRHLLVQVLYLVLDLEDVLLQLLLLLQPLHHEASQLLRQVLALLPLRLHPGLHLGDGVLQRQAFLLPSVFVGCGGGEGGPVPN